MNTRGPWIEHLMEDEGMTYPQAAEYLARYECIPYVENGEHMATLLKLNAEVHFAAYRRYRHKAYISARRLRAFLLPILDAQGFLTTKLGPGDDERFIRKLGFEQIGTSTSGQRIYMITEIKCIRSQACHSQP